MDVLRDDAYIYCLLGVTLYKSVTWKRLGSPVSHLITDWSVTKVPRFTRFLSLVLIRLVFTEIQPFENVKIYKEMYGNPDAVRGDTFLCRF